MDDASLTFLDDPNDDPAPPSAEPESSAFVIDEIDMALDHFGNFGLAHFVNDPLCGCRECRHVIKAPGWRQ